MAWGLWRRGVSRWVLGVRFVQIKTCGADESHRYHHWMRAIAAFEAG